MPKPKVRTVLVTLEIQTDAKLTDLRKKQEWQNAISRWFDMNLKVEQIHASVQQPPKAH